MAYKLAYPLTRALAYKSANPALGGAGPINPGVLPLNSRITFEGDSIMGTTAFSWFMMFGSGGRYFQAIGCQQGVAGNQVLGSGQMSDPAQTAAVNATLPKVVAFMGGTNDLQFGSATPAQIWAGIKVCLLAYFAGGARYVVISTVTARIAPNALTAPREADRVTLNGLIRAWASDPDLALYIYRVKLADCDLVFDPSIHALDGLHANAFGSKVCGYDTYAPILTSLIDPTSILVGYDTTANLLKSTSKNPELLGTTGTLNSGFSGQLATSLGGATSSAARETTVCSKLPAFHDGAEGQQLVTTATAATAADISSAGITSVTTNGQTGDIFEAFCYLEIPAGSVNLRAISLGCDTSITNFGSFNTVWDSIPAISGVLRTRSTLALAAPDANSPWTLNAIFAAGAGNATLKYSQPWLRLANAF